MIMYVTVALCMLTLVGGKIGEYLLVTDEVYMDVSIGGQRSGRITIGLFGDDVPRTVANFVALANNTYGYGYRGSKFHFVEYDWAIMGGDFEFGNGSGGYSIYGKYFPDEAFVVEDNGIGWVFMDNEGIPDTNSAVFIIVLYHKAAKLARGGYSLNLDGENVGFGRITKGIEVTEAISNLHERAKGFHPIVDIIITNCGAHKLPVYQRYWIEKQHEFVRLPLDMVKGRGEMSGEMSGGVVGVGVAVLLVIAY